MSTLGFIPSWQFSANPSVNPMVNPLVSMPDGTYQAGVYSSQPSLGYVLIDEGLGFVDSWFWKNRKTVILTAVGVGVLGMLTLSGRILR